MAKCDCIRNLENMCLTHGYDGTTLSLSTKRFVQNQQRAKATAPKPGFVARTLFEIMDDADALIGMPYHWYDRPESKSAGSKAVMKADIEKVLQYIDGSISEPDQYGMFASKTASEFRTMLNQLDRHTEGMANTVFIANAKMLVLNPIKSGLWKVLNANR
jgi:hypothetical protein